MERSWGHSPCFDLDWGLRENAYMTAKAYHILQKTENAKHIFTHVLHIFTHFYTCVSGFFWGLHMCKWIFLVYTCVSGFFLTYTFLHILTHPYTFRYIVVFLVHAFVQWHHMIWNQTELEWHVARLWSSVDVPSLGSNSLILFFSKLRLSNPKFRNITKFSSAAKNSKKTYETKVSSTQKIKMQNAMMKKKLLKYLSFHVQNNLK